MNHKLAKLNHHFNDLLLSYAKVHKVIITLINANHKPLIIITVQ